MRDRGIRRAHRERMVRRAYKILKIGGFKDEINLYLRSLRHADNMKICSCWMCGNPRRWSKGDDKLTIQERRMGRNPNELPDPELPEPGPVPEEPVEIRDDEDATVVIDDDPRGDPRPIF